MRAELKLVPPRPKRTPFWYIRGTYNGTEYCRSTGETDRRVAQQILKKFKADLRSGRVQEEAGPTFLTAVSAYVDYRGQISTNDRAFIDKLNEYFDNTPLAAIDQAAIDRAAVVMLPDAQPATRNRSVYTPMSAILRHAGVALALRRPKGAQGNARQHWLRPAEIEALLAAAWRLHARFAALLTILLYGGCRLSEALRLQVRDVELDAGFADLGHTKNGEPQRMHLPPVAVQAIRLALMQPANRTWTDQKLPRTSGSVFCLTKSGALYKLWNEAAAAAGVEIPADVAFHLLRHSFGAWTRGAGVRLEETGRWSSRGGAKPYDHFEITDAGRVADRFPGAAGGVPKLTTRAASGE